MLETHSLRRIPIAKIGLAIGAVLNAGCLAAARNRRGFGHVSSPVKLSFAFRVA